MKHIKKVLHLSMVGGLVAVSAGALAACDNSQNQNFIPQDNAQNQQGAFVIIEETAPGQYKIKEQFPSAETRVVLQQLDGTERVLTKEEMDALIKAEEAKIDNGTSNLTKDSASMSSGGLSLGEALLASAAGAIIGSWIGSKLFNNQNFANQQRNAFSNQSAYQRSVNSFNNRATSAPNSASSRSGFFGGQKSGTAAGSQSYGS